MHTSVVFGILLLITSYIHAKPQNFFDSSSLESKGDDQPQDFNFNRRSLRVDSSELASASSENTAFYRNYYQVNNEGRQVAASSSPYQYHSGEDQLAVESEPEVVQQANKNIKRRRRLQKRRNKKNQQGRNYDDDDYEDDYEDDTEDDIADYDLDDSNDDYGINDYELDLYRGGGKGHGGKGGKRGKKRGGEEEMEDPLKKFVPPFWLGKPKMGWGNSHVEQVGFIINNEANPGGWSVWPSGWTSGSGLDTGGLKYVDGHGWVGTVGAPWRQQTKQEWGPGYGWIKKDDDDDKKSKKGKKKGGKDKGKDKDKKEKGRKGGKGHKGKGKGGKGKKQKGKGKKKRQRDPCAMMGGGKKRGGKGGKGGKGKGRRGGGGHGHGHGGGQGRGGGGGWGMKDECDKGPKPWFGWPTKIKFIPPPPRGSQVWLKNQPPRPVKSGWSDYHGWNWKNKLNGWGISDLIGVVHLDQVHR